MGLKKKLGCCLGVTQKAAPKVDDRHDEHDNAVEIRRTMSFKPQDYLPECSEASVIHSVATPSERSPLNSLTSSIPARKTSFTKTPPAHKEEYETVAAILWHNYESDYAVVNIFATEEQFVKASEGCETDIPFQDYYANLEQPVCVHGDLHDSVSAEMEHVVGAPHLRNYLGVPLKIDDKVVGVLAVLGVNEPRIFSEKDIDAMKDFGNMLEHILIRHQTRLLQAEETEQVRVQNDFLIAGIDLCSEGFVLLRNNPKTASKEVVYVNNGWQKISGFASDVSVGKEFRHLLQEWGAKPTAISQCGPNASQDREPGTLEMYLRELMHLMECQDLDKKPVAQFDLSVPRPRREGEPSSTNSEDGERSRMFYRFRSCIIENTQIPLKEDEGISALLRSSSDDSYRLVPTVSDSYRSDDSCFVKQTSSRRNIKTKSKIEKEHRLVFVHITEVTEETEALAKLEEAFKELESTSSQVRVADQAKRNFMKLTSQETRIPLNAILGFSEILNANPKLQDEQRQLAKIVQQASFQLLGLISGVLDINNSESKVFQLEHESFNLNECVDMCMDLQSHHAKNPDKEVVWYCDLNVPSIVYGDVTRLSQVLTNLLTNACKFTRSGTVSVCVTALEQTPEVPPDAILPPPFLLNTPDIAVPQWKAGDNKGNEPVWMLFQVSDTGIGLPEDAQEWLFKLFSQGDSSTTRQFGGSGIGLVICQQLVEHMGGKIYVTRNKEGGCTFHFYVILYIKAEDRVRTGRKSESRVWNPKIKVIGISKSDLWHKSALSTMHKLGFMERSIKRIKTKDEFDGLLSKLKDFDAQQKTYTGAQPLEAPNYYLLLVDEDRMPITSVAMVRYFHQLVQECKCVILTGIFSSFPSPPNNNPAETRMHFLSPPMTVSQMEGVVESMCALEYEHPSLYAPFRQDVDGSAPCASSSTTASSVHKTTQRILVVDDTESNCNVMRLLLEHIGFKFLDFAHNGLQAIEMVQRSDAENNPYRLVFMDLHMPVMDGLTAFKNMKKLLGSRTPAVVALTADVVDGVEEDCYTAGMVAYLSKPVSLKKIQDMCCTRFGLEV